MWHWRLSLSHVGPWDLFGLWGYLGSMVSLKDTDSFSGSSPSHHPFLGSIHPTLRAQSGSLSRSPWPALWSPHNPFYSIKPSWPDSLDSSQESTTRSFGQKSRGWRLWIDCKYLLINSWTCLGPPCLFSICLSGFLWLLFSLSAKGIVWVCGGGWAVGRTLLVSLKKNVPSCRRRKPSTLNGVAWSDYLEIIQCSKFTDEETSMDEGEVLTQSNGMSEWKGHRADAWGFRFQFLALHPLLQDFKLCQPLFS